MLLYLLGINQPIYSLPFARYVHLTQNCSRFVDDFGYTSYRVTDEEKDFQIAFGLLTYENFEQTERLLHLVYRPQNAYCIHVDAKAPKRILRAATAVARCFENVFVASPSVFVEWGELSVLVADLLCAKELLGYPRWRYFVNLVGRDFPLKTNLELVRILKAYNGSNDMNGSRK